MRLHSTVKQLTANSLSIEIKVNSILDFALESKTN